MRGNKDLSEVKVERSGARLTFSLTDVNKTDGKAIVIDGERVEEKILLDSRRRLGSNRWRLSTQDGAQLEFLGLANPTGYYRERQRGSVLIEAHERPAVLQAGLPFAGVKPCLYILVEA